MYVNASALDALSTIQAVSANNLANMNTNRFQASRVHLQEQAQGGVRVASITKDPTPGPLVPEQRLVERDGRVEQEEVLVPASNTDPVREFTTMVATKHAFTANVKAISARADMLGTLMDMQA
ncbi:MAG: flagellar biosynthesis protein FlgG [Deltaproteobacteria bacterium]|nr:flagellar biosynthesis protein FlgG [Deltaproteobacteria bacterium]